jgi:two-component system, LytTR family, response regulator
MEKLSALIVDDEEKAVSLLKNILEETGEFSDIRCADSATTAKQKLESFAADLVFLDIRMPGKDGLTFLRELYDQRTTSEIVFVTAYDQYAVTAIQNHAFGYLLKPVSLDKLGQCISDFRSKIGRPDLLQRLTAFIKAQEIATRLRVNTRNGYFFIDPDEIMYCEADGNYTNVFTADKQHVCTLQLNMIQDMLPKTGFMRVGRSLIISIKYISNVDRKSKVLTFEKASIFRKVTVSRRQLKEFEQQQSR